MRIMVVTYSYCPSNDPRAFRWGAICEYWAERGIIVDVVCSYTTAHLPKLEQLNGVNIHRVHDPLQTFRTKDFDNRNISSSLSSWRIKFKNSIQAILKKIILLLRWPDFAWLWIPKAYYQTAHLLKSHHYDGIFSVALPFSSHIVVLCLWNKRKNIPWVCDYGDPFSFLKCSSMNNDRIYRGLNRYIERKVMNSSQKISVTNLETTKKYIAYLKVYDGWFNLIPPLIKTRNIVVDKVNENSNTDDKHIHLIFAGTLYEKIRNPKFLLSLLSKARNSILTRKLVIHFYGPIGDCKKEFEMYPEAINDWIFLHGSVDQMELKRIYATADVLVNIGNATTYQTPSKIIEYISTGLPILNVTSITEDSSIPMLEFYTGALSIYQGNGVTEDVINSLCTFFYKEQRVNRLIIDEILKPYQCDAIANSYLRLLS